MKKIFSRQQIELESDNVAFEEECDLTIHYYPGRRAGGGERIPNGRGNFITGPPLDPPELEDVELISVDPADSSTRWSEPMRDAITSYFQESDKLFEIVAEDG